MTNVLTHKNDNPSMCLYCKNFRLIPCEIPGIFKCENKNSPDEVKLCDNFVDRQKIILDEQVTENPLIYKA